MDRRIIAVAASAYGALWGWALTADRWEQKLKEREDVAAARTEILRRKVTEVERERTALSLVRQIQEDSPAIDAENSPGGVTAETSVTDGDSEVTGEQREETRSHLQGLIDQYAASPEDVDTFVNRAEIAEADLVPPFVISREQFSGWEEDEEGLEYAKITLMYFPRSRLLLDDDEDPIDDVANMVGWKNLRQFGGDSGDPDVVFVRNRRLNTDFEVVKEEENDPPLHVQYGMGKEEFKTNRAAGLIKLRPEDDPERG